MGKPIIVVGDKTDHGGVVVQGSMTSDINGIPIARIGDQTSCPIPGHGSNPIVSGDPTCIVDGMPVARLGDKTACGATLLPAQMTTHD